MSSPQVASLLLGCEEGEGRVFDKVDDDDEINDDDNEEEDDDDVKNDL